MLRYPATSWNRNPILVHFKKKQSSQWIQSVLNVCHFISNYFIGAIGSNRKIDASYLSPHVNFTEFLESSTKEYGIPLLLSEPFYKLLSPQAQKYCRQVDRIKRTNGDEPIGLYTYDCDMNIDWNDHSRHVKTGESTYSPHHHHQYRSFTYETFFCIFWWSNLFSQTVPFLR